MGGGGGRGGGEEEAEEEVVVEEQEAFRSFRRGLDTPDVFISRVLSDFSLTEPNCQYISLPSVGQCHITSRQREIGQHQKTLMRNVDGGGCKRRRQIRL